MKQVIFAHNPYIVSANSPILSLPAIFFVLLNTFAVSAQEPDDNIIIQSAKETYRFATGDASNPVVVKQSLQVSYLCNKYRAEIPVVEFYNDQVQLTDVDVRVDGDRVKNLKTVREYYGSDGIFYSDARICYFSLPFAKKGTRSEVTVAKTVLDPRYFTTIYLTENFFIEKKEVEIIVPSWMQIELREFNFKGYTITKRSSPGPDGMVHSFTIEKAPAFIMEKQAPGISHLAPHLLVLSKYATPMGQKINFFNTLEDQYAWYRMLVKQIGNEKSVVAAKAQEITQGITDEIEKVKTIFQWTQNNIRYIAYEDGIAGFRPEKAQDVLNKKYGDCKGMANLTTEMLRSLGMDARLCWLGTNHIAYNYSTPSLGVDNHMICAWMNNGRIYYLDPTEKYIGFNEIAERIQGREVLIEDGEKFLLQKIPVSNPRQNTSLEKRTLTIRGNDLHGKVVHVWKGETKEWLLAQLHEMQQNKQEENLKRYLSQNNSNHQVENLKIFNIDDFNSDLRVEYDLLLKDAVITVGKEMFIDLDDRKDFSQLKFDTAKRKMPYQFRFKTHIQFETEIQLPPDARAGTLPSILDINNPSYRISARYKSDKSVVSYKREILLENTLLQRKDIPEWNDNIGKLNDFYSNQLTLTNEK